VTWVLFPEELAPTVEEGGCLCYDIAGLNRLNSSPTHPQGWLLDARKFLSVACSNSAPMDIQDPRRYSWSYTRCRWSPLCSQPAQQELFSRHLCKTWSVLIRVLCRVLRAA